MGSETAPLPERRSGGVAAASQSRAMQPEAAQVDRFLAAFDALVDQLRIDLARPDPTRPDPAHGEQPPTEEGSPPAEGPDARVLRYFEASMWLWLH
ncbi:hypothetical protein GCM10009839_58000 [Catenulispora yoronensis]|uniref:Uncharacterized protein n=1 Tax=Catenulispora yoronensis TaxID=450799 RepID=A0ABP5GIV1_9ACTN